MRILHVTPYAPATWAYGGIPRLVGALTRALGRRGHHVTIAATDVSDATTRLTARGPARPSRPVSFTDNDVDVQIFPNVSNYLAYDHQLFLPLGFHTYLKQHARTFDVAHLHACRNAPGALAAWHLRRAGVPYVLAPNGTAPRIERQKFAKALYDISLGNRTLRNASRVLAVSEIECRQLGHLGVSADRIDLIPNSIDLDEFEPPVQTGFRGRFELPAGRVVLFLGKLTPRKCVDVLVRAFARLRDVDTTLVIAGNDMGAEASLRRLIGALGLERRTRFTGLLANRTRLEALADADVVVYPSEHEIFGLVPLEALLCGTPVVVADDSGCGNIIRTTGGGVVTPLGDAAALAEAITRILDAPAAWREAAARAASGVRATYGADVVAARVERMYGRIIAGTARCAA